MTPSVRLLIACALVIVGSAAQAADNCEALRSRIEANIASNGVIGFSVTVVDVAADVPGEVVGSCGQGSKKIVYARSGALAIGKPLAPVAPPAKLVTQPSTAASPEAGKSQGILTECKDGTVSVGGDCKN